MIENLRELGFAPEDVSDVVYTHLHGDHIGWTSVDGRVTFPNATHRCDARDLAHFYGPDEGVTIRLMAAADRIETWDGDETLAAGVDLRPMPGHTPGSTVVVLSSGTQRALLLGDVVHCPVELVDDEWEGLGDVDPVLARKVRNAMARELDDGEVLVGAAHFPGLRFGRLLAGSTARRWVISEALA